MALSITDKIRSSYVDAYLESSKKIHYTELDKKHGVRSVFYSDLPKTEVNGYPFASDYVDKNGNTYSVTEFLELSEKAKKQCKLRYHYLPYSHELYVGTTGSGKTTGCVEPQLRAISAQKNKPNLFLTDPKGELYDHNARHLLDNGYEVFIMNFKDLSHSDRWNPLLELYETQMQKKEVGVGCVAVKGMPGKDLILTTDISAFDGSIYTVYKGMAFPNGQALDLYLDFENDFLNAKIDSLINELVNMFITVQNTKDASWEYGAQDLLKGILHCMLEDALDDKSGFTKDMMTIKTIHEYYLAIRNSVLSDSNNSYKLREHPLVKDKSEKAKALMATALDNAPNTMRSYCGVFDGAFKDWVQAHIVALTTGNTVNIEALDKPYAIFVVTRDYEKSDFQVAGLFIDWVYRKALEKAEAGDCSRALHFMLDEFGNIPKIKDLENKIATSRSRNIWFHLVVQSYKQIDIVYGDDKAVVVRDNCNAQIFLGAQNRKTKEIFAEECGKHYIPTLESKLIPDNHSMREAPLIPVSALDLITPGQMYVKRLYMPVVTSQFIRSYVAAANGDFKDFINANCLKTCAKINIDPFNSPKYTYEKLKIKEKPNKFSWD